MEKSKDRFSMKYLIAGILSVIIFFLFSNIYQAYRYDFQAVGQVDLAKLKNPFTASINFDATIENFKARPGTWEFNFLVFNHQHSKPGMFTEGKVFWEAMKSSIPRVLWPDKQFMLVDEILAKLYNADTKEIDIGKNIFGLVQVDCGYLSLIIVPLIIITILAIMAALIRMTMHYPTFLWLFSGNILFYLVNIEENGNEIFFMFRNIAFIFIIFFCYLVANKICELHAPKVRSSL